MIKRKAYVVTRASNPTKYLAGGDNGVHWTPNIKLAIKFKERDDAIATVRSYFTFTGVNDSTISIFEILI